MVCAMSRAALILMLFWVAIVQGTKEAGAQEQIQEDATPTELKPNGLFADHMVLQRGVAAPVWGKAKPGAVVEVTFRDTTVSATANDAGKWSVKVGPYEVGGPFQMVIASGGERRVVEDVLIGDVWVASGQSNMVWAVAHSKNPQEEIAAAKYPQIRLMSVKNVQSQTKPLDDLPTTATWAECSPESVRLFSAVAYHFGRQLHQHLNVPIGLIDTSEGATYPEPWMSSAGFAGDPDVEAIAKRWQEMDDFSLTPAGKAQLVKVDEQYDELEKAAKAKGKHVWRNDSFNPPLKRRNHVSALWNARVHPLIPMAIKGVIWYQGEASPSRAHEYRKLFPALIADWRAQWGQGDFPFLYVQLANWGGIVKPDIPRNSDWAELREAQMMALKTSPHTAMVVAIDIGDPGDIHAKNKQDVGARLALAARGIAYGEKIVYSGPLYQSSRVEGNRIRVAFDSVGGGLIAKDGPLKRFAIAGDDQKFVWANAEIEGDSVVVWSEEVQSPRAVRYAWWHNPEGCNLYNKEGLPASPFRTDDWPGITEKNSIKHQVGKPVVFEGKPSSADR